MPKIKIPIYILAFIFGCFVFAAMVYFGREIGLVGCW